MTRFRLARSIAAPRRLMAGLVVLTALSCQAGEPIEGDLTPAVTVVGVQLSPDTATIAPDGTVNFTVQLNLSDGSTVNGIAVGYNATGGTIDGGGLYTANHAAGTFRVVATANAHSDTSVVVIEGDTEPDLIRLSLNPGSAALLPGATQQFQTDGVFSDSSVVPLSVDYTATGGSIGSSGRYTAGQTPGVFKVFATVKGGVLADTANIEIGSPPVNLVRLQLTPPSATVSFGQSFQFEAVGRLSDSTTTTVPVTWTATGGTVSSTGNYTAGSNSGNFRIIARTSNGLADTSTISVSAPVITRLDLKPDVADLQVGQIQQFTATATLANGNTQNNPSVTYTFTGGLMTQGGLYTAGVLPGTYQVIARTANGVADTSTVNISLAILSALNIAPQSATVATGQTFQFDVTGTLSNGGIQPDPDVDWTATGGSVSSNGLFTAPNTVGTYQVRASSLAALLSGTATVTVQAAPPSTMFFNSSEAGCGSDSNVLLCDDFEDGDWYTKNCDQANASGGLGQVDGWCGSIYGPTTPALCGNAGVKSNCAASHGNATGSQGGVTYGDHSLSQSSSEVYVRYYTKPMPGYQFGAEKVLTFNRGPAGVGGIFFGNLHINCGSSSRSSSGMLMWQPTGAESGCRNIISMTPGNWYFIEVHMNSATGVLQVWADDCGADGTTCTGAPTLRLNLSGYRIPAGTVGSLWFESWANPGSTGVRLIDQIKVSKVGPIGRMP